MFPQGDYSRDILNWQCQLRINIIINDIHKIIQILFLDIEI